MFKRVIWWASGAVMGAGGSTWLQRKVRRTVQAKRERYAPSKVAERVGDRLTSSVRGVGETVRDVIDEGRAGMREREAELLAELESPRPRQRLHRRAFTKYTKRENPKGTGTADVGLLQPHDALDHR